MQRESRYTFHLFPFYVFFWSAWKDYNQQHTFVQWGIVIKVSRHHAVFVHVTYTNRGLFCGCLSRIKLSFLSFHFPFLPHRPYFGISNAVSSHSTLRWPFMANDALFILNTLTQKHRKHSNNPRKRVKLIWQINWQNNIHFQRHLLTHKKRRKKKKKEMEKEKITKRITEQNQNERPFKHHQ